MNHRNIVFSLKFIIIIIVVVIIFYDKEWYSKWFWFSDEPQN